ncbi:MAG: hypothetical protein DME90_06645 [Verrucomicrobia bacterium]|nr:MAG: hypothetical protein DME90_06645 [Verrucomicrobiota bacterium]
MRPPLVCRCERAAPVICARRQAAINDVSIQRMRSAVHVLFAANVLLVALFLGSCETTPQGIHQARIEMAQHIAAEPAGDYFIGRRYYKPDFKFWGYIRRPGQPWSAAQLVMLNEKEKLAPDRERLEFGSDNNYEYKLFGHFSGQTVYEPASNGFYPEFVLKGYEIISTNPPPIFRSQIMGRPTPTELRYTVEKPE